MSSTIFAHSTPLGKSALCIFRISGTQALRVKPLAIGIIFYSKVAKHLTGVNLGQFPNTFRRVALKQDRKVIDSGLAYFFKGIPSAYFHLKASTYRA
jgi:tRNA U34 5-carboxymethylaminomethyl modifying GTPase MnmE/TrmE